MNNCVQVQLCASLSISLPHEKYSISVTYLIIVSYYDNSLKLL